MNPREKAFAGRCVLTERLAVAYHLRCRHSTAAILEDTSLLRIGRHVPLGEDLRFLEIGPRTGTVAAAHLCALGKDLTLFDRWGYWPAWAAMQSANPRLKAVIGDANMELPFKSESFDVVICMATLNYLTNPDAVLAEINRVLKPNGQLFASTVRGEGNLAFELGLLDVANMPVLWGLEELSKAVVATGFEIKDRMLFGICSPILTSLHGVFTHYAHYRGRIHTALSRRYPNRESFAGVVAVKPE